MGGWVWWWYTTLIPAQICFVSLPLKEPCHMQFILNNSRLLSYLRGWVISSEPSNGYESKNLLSSTRTDTEVQVFFSLTEG